MINNSPKYDLSWVTFLFCILTKTEELRNLELVLKYIEKYFQTNILIYEIGMTKLIPTHFHSKKVKICFFQNNGIHKSKYIKRMVSETDSAVISLWNPIFLVSPKQIIESANEVFQGNADYSYPFGGKLYKTNRQLLEVIIENNIELNVIAQNEKMLRAEKEFFPEIILIDTIVYKNSGLENENIKNSALSCLEREKRFEILGLKKHQANGILLQIQNKNCHRLWKSGNKEIQMDLKELLRICKMKPENLKININNNS